MAKYFGKVKFHMCKEYQFFKNVYLLNIFPRSELLYKTLSIYYLAEQMMSNQNYLHLLRKLHFPSMQQHIECKLQKGRGFSYLDCC